jgi:maltooligosyltrehalose trehalohydrolase
MHHFVGFIQNHDQVGNRATGDRLEHIVGMEQAKVALGLVLTGPFIPLLFQGEEFAASTPFQYFAHHEDQEMARAVSEGRKREFAAFGWAPDEVPDPESRETFERSKLNWSEIGEGQHAEMLDWCRKLIALRRGSTTLNNGEPGHVKVSFSEDERWLVMDRESIRVALNLGKDFVALKKFQNYRMVLPSEDDIRLESDTLHLPPSRLAILSQDDPSTHTMPEA